MAKTKLVFIGKSIKPHGVKGDLLIEAQGFDVENFLELESVFVDVGGEPVPFFIDSAFVHSSTTLIVKFEDVDTEKKARSLCGFKLLIPARERVSPESESLEDVSFSEIRGYTLVDKKYGELGELSRVIEYPNNPLFQVFYKGKEVLIPINEETVLKVNHRKEIIYVSLPEGLMDL
ncbi:MAG: ribosome maturation factor RimM [Bacteroidota bacterium]|nr:ribosome maturation factor RimM [Bacteroidota bacterium]